MLLSSVVVEHEVRHAELLRQLARVLDRGVVLLVGLKNLALGIEAERLVEHECAP